jgi:hypothetical protein
MHISFSPMRCDDELTVIKSGDALTINGVTYDFSPLPDGGTLPREAVDCEWLASDVERIDGEIHLTLILPHGPTPPPGVAFPEPITVTDDGPITLPGDEA